MLKHTVKVISTSALIFLGVVVPSAMADDHEKPEVRYYEVALVNFKPGKMRSAVEIIKKHFAPVSEKTGVPGPKMIHFDTGKWDMMLMWHLKGGYAEKEYGQTED